MVRFWMVLGVALLAGCASGGQEEESDDFVVDFSATLEPRPGFGEVTGTVRAVASLGRTAITLELDGGEAGARYPWHVHHGRCGSGGNIVGSATAYPLIEPDAGGDDRVVATIRTQLADDADYHVNVHASPDDLGTIVACGRLVD